MSTHNQRHGHARCGACGHDLTVVPIPVEPPAATPTGLTSNGHVYCTNPDCGWHEHAYVLSPFIEDGGQRT
jgi:hypothetical protein